MKTKHLVLIGTVLLSLIVLISIACTLPKDNPNEESSAPDTSVNVITESQPIETKQPQLEDSCKYILARGNDENGSYVLVANQTEDYSGAHIQIGVIKNNTWLLEPTSNMPFINENGILQNGKGLEALSKGYSNYFHYLGKGAFIFSYTYDYANPSILDIVYNAETKKSFEHSPLVQNISNVKMDIMDMYTGYYSSVFTDPGCDYIIIEEVKRQGYHEMILLNICTMETKKIQCDTKQFPGDTEEFRPISDGIIIAFGGKHVSFYSIDGKIIFDEDFQFAVSPRTSENYLVMKNGKCSLAIENNNGTKYYITLNKQGEVVEQKIIS